MTREEAKKALEEDSPDEAMTSSDEVETLKKKIVHEIETLGYFNSGDVERGGISAYLPCTMKELVLLLGLLERTIGEEEV